MLEDALRKLCDDQPTEDIEREVAGTRERVASLRKQLQALNSVQKSLGYACMHKKVLSLQLSTLSLFSFPLQKGERVATF